MAAVLEFRCEPRRRRRPAGAETASVPSRPRACEIVIFPGVRIARDTDEADNAASADTVGNRLEARDD